MALASGSKLGPYEIISPLGAGGMGEVYRAIDTRLDRTVAVKILPSHLSENSEARQRFAREARAISSLNHPNICHLYDVGEQEGTSFLVMEYLEGDTLSDRLRKGPMSGEQVLKVGAEICEGLEKAHRSGIVHRDLKPSNVMLTKSGAKLMDFGLAKPNESTSGSKSGTPAYSAVATLASMASPVTMAGTVVGTLQYMSPEQIQGKEADARSDIFSFGAMLYEMLTGKRAFEGKSQLSVASAILEKEPDPISAVQPMTPPALEQVVRTCLAKEPEERFQSAHDLKLQLQWIAAGGTQVAIPVVVASQRKRVGKVLVLAASAAGWILAVVLGILAVIYAGRFSSARPLIRSEIGLPSGFDLADASDGAPALSPDGQRLAFVAVRKGTVQGDSSSRTMILLRQMSSDDAIPLLGTEAGSFPFWSPDGKYLGFFAGGKLKKVDASGGPPQIICEAPDGRGGTWNQGGTIVFAPRIEGALAAVSEGGGSPSELVAARKDEAGFTNRNPLFLPDGKHILYTARGGKDPVAAVYAAALDGSTPKQILPAGSNVAYSDGYLFYLKEGTLTAQRFDPAALRVEGNPISLAANVEYWNARDLGSFSVSHNGLVYRSSAVRDHELTWLDLSGKEVDHWGEPGAYVSGTFSPGSRMAVLYRANPNGRGNSLWLADPERRTVTRLTPDSDQEQSAVVAADGKSVFISSTDGYTVTLVQRWLTASAKEEKQFESSHGYSDVVSISRDGRYVFFNEQDVKTGFDIYYLDLKGEHKLVPLLNSSYQEFDARLSPDGKWLAYTSNETGRVELFVTPFPNVGSKWQVSNGGVTVRDTQNIMDWSPDGKNLRYEQEEKIYDVQIRNSGDKLEFSAPRELMSLPGDAIVLSIMPDGKRTLIARSTGDRSPVPMKLVLNWQHLVQ
jgi:eukaryotic-like serine/threonine-protein kinase